MLEDFRLQTRDCEKEANTLEFLMDRKGSMGPPKSANVKRQR